MMKSKVRSGLSKSLEHLLRASTPFVSVGVEVLVAPLTNHGPQASNCKAGNPICKTVKYKHLL